MGGMVVGWQSFADEDARSGHGVGKGFPTLYYEFRVVRKGLEKTPDRSPQAWRALQV
ncbi:phage late control D family protein [Methylocaldum marinum]|uniref:Phage late control D family protein n=1 Tax=Methylocaldum marinum TaxID=1432792 RepID=A0A250KQX9_9GAMM|nr:phage late control D family protein [Methylocaldum marinum]